LPRSLDSCTGERQTSQISTRWVGHAHPGIDAIAIDIPLSRNFVRPPL